jgi:transposase-like protein
MDQIEPTMSFLESPDRLPYGAIERIAEETAIEANTLRDWRQELKGPCLPVEGPWRPYQNRNARRRAVTDEQEATLAKMKIEMNRI